MKYECRRHDRTEARRTVALSSLRDSDLELRAYAPLKRLLRNHARRYAARHNFPLDQGLAPLAHYKAAASRLIFRGAAQFVPLQNCNRSFVTASETVGHPLSRPRCIIHQCGDIILSVTKPRLTHRDRPNAPTRRRRNSARTKLQVLDVSEVNDFLLRAQPTEDKTKPAAAIRVTAMTSRGPTPSE